MFISLAHYHDKMQAIDGLLQLAGQGLHLESLICSHTPGFSHISAESLDALLLKPKKNVQYQFERIVETSKGEIVALYERAMKSSKPAVRKSMT